MSTRLNYRRMAPDLYEKLGAASAASAASVDPILSELIKVRVSQINGCAFCIDMHTKALRKYGESEQRIYLLNAWRETSFFTERERAALGLAEAITRLTDGNVPDEVFDAAQAHFSDDELIHLVYVATIINAWNRLAITFRPQIPGSPA